jgi:membrane-bound metal-dependent hydrolase YbcI (DUF457 family)
MGVGHLALGFASKRVTPKLSLGLLLLAGLFLDAVWALAIATGLEHARIAPGITAASALDLYDYPISHSLVAALGWSLLFGGAYFAFRKDRLGAVVLAAGVASHWLLDVASHRADVPVFPHGPYLGLGLWNSLIGAYAVEGLILLLGVVVYARATRGRDAIGRFGFALLVLFLFVGLVASYAGSPPNMTAVVVGTAVLALPLIAAEVVDRHRDPSTPK